MSAYLPGSDVKYSWLESWSHFKSYRYNGLYYIFINCYTRRFNKIVLYSEPGLTFKARLHVKITLLSWKQRFLRIDRSEKLEKYSDWLAFQYMYVGDKDDETKTRPVSLHRHD